MENFKLIKFRKSLGKTQDEMANSLDVSTSFYQKIENGERNPSFNFIQKFKSKFKDVDINGIFFANQLHG